MVEKMKDKEDQKKFNLLRSELIVWKHGAKENMLKYKNKLKYRSEKHTDEKKQAKTKLKLERTRLKNFKNKVDSLSFQGIKDEIKDRISCGDDTVLLNQIKFV